MEIANFSSVPHTQNQDVDYDSNRQNLSITIVIRKNDLTLSSFVVCVPMAITPGISVTVPFNIICTVFVVILFFVYRYLDINEESEENQDRSNSDLEIVESEKVDAERDENEDSESAQMMDLEFEQELSSPEQCLRWLSSIGYGHYVSKLRSQWEEDEMDGRTLPLLDLQDLVCFVLCGCSEIFCSFNCF